jgi:GTP-binding protein Era
MTNHDLHDHPDHRDLDSIFNDDFPENHRSGVVAVVGRPNAGKSTLINQLLGQKIAIVSPKPQTTRRQQLGIYSQKDAQLLFVDTPGLHKPQHKLGEFMVEVAERALRDADVILWLIDVSEPLHPGDRAIAETVKKAKNPVMLALNKVDLVPDRELTEYTSLIDAAEVHRISALKGTGVRELLQALIAQMPLGPRYYPADQVSEVNLRFLAAEAIREKVMLHTEEEIPHSVAVDIEEYREREDGTHYISATIYVERDSQKGIVIGKQGSMIKQIGSEARVDLEKELDAKVFLDLHVKVLKNWRSDDALMQRLGYRISRDKDDNR